MLLHLGLKIFYTLQKFVIHKVVVDVNKNHCSKANYFNKKKTIVSYLFIFSLAAFFIISGTNYFFNFMIWLSFFLNKVYFMYFRIVYTIEYGYYKHVVFFIDTLRVLSLALLILFILRKTRIKLSHVFMLSISLIMLLNFTLLKKDNLEEGQVYDMHMVKARNILAMINRYSIDTRMKGQIITNYYPVCRLIAPQGVQFKFSKTKSNSISLSNDNGKNSIYLLLEKDRLNNNLIDSINRKIFNKNYIVKYNGYGFLFLKIVS